MKQSHIPGGVFADNRPDGIWICSAGPLLLSSFGELHPPVAMMFNRLTPDGQVKIASKSSSPGTCYVWDGVWLDTGLDSPGSYAHGWYPDGSLALLTGGPHQDSNGLRYYDPEAVGGNADVFQTTPGWVTGSPTYGPGSEFSKSKHVSRLFEWTDIGRGVYVGQGDQGGTVIQHPTFGHRLLIDGDSRFVQGKRSGNTLAIAVSRVIQEDAVLFWLEEHEIGNLPIYKAPIQPPIEPPIDPPVEVPVPTPDPRLVQIVTDYWNASGIVAETAAHFNEHPESHWKERHARTLYESLSLAYHDKGVTAFGVYPKTSGTRFVPFPDKPNEAYAEDIVQIKDTAGVMFYKDIGIGFGGPTPSIQWGEFSRSSDADQHPGAYLPPPKLTAGQPPIEPPIDPPASCNCQSQIDALTLRVTALEQKPAAGIDGKRIALKASHGKYVAFEPSGFVVADRDAVGGWEIVTTEEQ